VTSRCRFAFYSGRRHTKETELGALTVRTSGRRFEATGEWVCISGCLRCIFRTLWVAREEHPQQLLWQNPAHTVRDEKVLFLTISLWMQVACSQATLGDR
jgi:hypothetical protein